VNAKGTLWSGIVGIAAMLTLAPPIAGAKDYCFNVGPTYELIGQRFTIPKKGQCTRWNGFTSVRAVNSPAMGTACTASNGSKLSLTITTGVGAFILIDSITLSLPSLNGIDYNVLLGGPAAPEVSTVAAAVCPKNTTPAIRMRQ
jgi:hypothetical protein